MAIQPVRGVALIIQNSDSEGEILILQEYETKFQLGKYSGMFSIPMETSYLEETDYCALLRLIQEELPGFDLALEQALQSRIGIYHIVPHAWVTLYSAKMNNKCLPRPESREVGNYQWVNPEKALSLWLRQGAWEMINDFMNGRKGVFCHDCRAPRNI